MMGMVSPMLEHLDQVNRTRADIMGMVNPLANRVERLNRERAEMMGVPSPMREHLDQVGKMRADLMATVSPLRDHVERLNRERTGLMGMVNPMLDHLERMNRERVDLMDAVGPVREYLERMGNESAKMMGAVSPMQEYIERLNGDRVDLMSTGYPLREQSVSVTHAASESVEEQTEPRAESARVDEVLADEPHTESSDMGTNSIGKPQPFGIRVTATAPRPETRNRVRIVLPVGSRLRPVLVRLFHPRKMELVFDPIMADLRHEDFEALREGRRVKSAWVCLRGYWSVASAIFFQAVVSIAKTVVAYWRSVSAS